MIRHFILKLGVISSSSCLITITLVEGLLLNLMQIDLTRTQSFSNESPAGTRFLFSFLLGYSKLLASLSFILILALIYLVYSLALFKNTFVFGSHFRVKNKEQQLENEKVEPSDGNEQVEAEKKNSEFILLFQKILPMISLSSVVFFLFVLALSKSVYVPQGNLYHTLPVSFLQAQQQTTDAKQMKNNQVESKLKKTLKLFSSKSKELITLNSNKLSGSLGDTSTESKLKSLPWNILSLTRAQVYQLEFKYYKYLFFTLLTLISFILLLVRLNICTKAK
jgi:hypothetical protein